MYIAPCWNRCDKNYPSQCAISGKSWCNRRRFILWKVLKKPYLKRPWKISQPIPFNNYLTVMGILCHFKCSQVPLMAEPYLRRHDQITVGSRESLAVWVHLHDFYKGKQLLWLPICFPGQCSPFKIGSTLKGKNLLLKEQILFFKSWPLLRWEAKMKIEELLPWKRTHSPTAEIHVL